MIFIPATESDYMRLSCTTRKGSSRTTRGANFRADERGLIVRQGKIAEAISRVVEEDNYFTNGSIVYVSKSN